MTFNVLITGVGGTGGLMVSTILARAANLDGYDVGGIQLHGLAQRGGSNPTHIRFGRKVPSPTIPRAQADLIIGLEMIEPARACYFADKSRTSFLIDTYKIIPVYANLSKVGYPSIIDVKKMLSPFAKTMMFVNAAEVCDSKLGDAVYSNSMLLAIAQSRGLLPISRKSLLAAIKKTLPRDLDKNLDAFRLGEEFHL